MPFVRPLHSTRTSGVTSELSSLAVRKKNVRNEENSTSPTGRGLNTRCTSAKGNAEAARRVRTRNKRGQQRIPTEIKANMRLLTKLYVIGIYFNYVSSHQTERRYCTVAVTMMK